MSKHSKQLEKFRQNPKNVRYEELESLLLHLGFQKRKKSGSHNAFTYPGHATLTIPRTQPFLKPVYVKLALQFIDELDLLEED